jgi:hypothetical protein
MTFDCYIKHETCTNRNHSDESLPVDNICSIYVGGRVLISFAAKIYSHVGYVSQSCLCINSNSLHLIFGNQRFTRQEISEMREEMFSREGRLFRGVSSAKAEEFEKKNRSADLSQRM